MLVLSNKGTDAFEPATWGTEIVIERRLKRVGGSSFKVFGRDDQGKQVTDTFTSATQVATIVDFFNIQGTQKFTSTKYYGSVSLILDLFQFPIRAL
jgi:chromosome segregation ATPase